MTSPVSNPGDILAASSDSSPDRHVPSEEYGPRRGVERIFEAALFNCRFVVLLAVVGSMIAAIMMFFKGCIELLQALAAFGTTLGHLQVTRSDDKSVMINIIPAIDNYMFAIVLLIFSMGTYELFISKLDPAGRTEDSRPNWLKVDSVGELKSQIGKVIMMLLIVNLFEHAFSITVSGPADLLYFGGSILLVALSLIATQNISLHRRRAEDRTS